jgi:recombination protein RecA
VEYGIVKKSGSWFSYGETKLAQGRDATKKLVQDNPELAVELEEKIFAAIKSGVKPENQKSKKDKDKDNSEE